MHGNDLHVAFYNRLPTGFLDLCRRQNRIIMFCPCLEILIQYRIDPIFVFRNSYFAVVRCNGWRYSTKIGKSIVINPYPIPDVTLGHPFRVKVIAVSKSCNKNGDFCGFFRISAVMQIQLLPCIVQLKVYTRVTLDMKGQLF